MLYSVILYFVHLCIDFFFILQLLYRDFQRSICRFLKFYRDLVPLNELDRQVQLKKLPIHLGIIITEENISFNDISNILNWSLCQGIYHISIYDDRGYVKTNSKTLYHDAIVHKDIYFKSKSQNYNIKFSDGKIYYSNNSIIKNGHITEDLHVYLLSSENGKQYIVDAAKNVCKDAVKNTSILQNFHAKDFESYIKDVIDIPDPQLILVFGKISGLLGYLPWHIRLSEIMFYPTHHKLQFEQFHEFLCRYSKCEQRFGT